MRHQAIGVIALVLLLGAATIWMWPLEWSMQEALLGAMVRVGAVMGALWLAYDDVKRLPPWILAVVPLLLLILAIKPKWFLIALPIVIALAILKPRIGPSR